MERSHFLRLTLVLYRLSRPIPEKEPLRFSIREIANAVLADLILFGFDNQVTAGKFSKREAGNRILASIEILDVYLEVAVHQTWVRENHHQILKREYQNISREIKNALGVQEDLSSRPIKEKEVREAEEVKIPLRPPEMSSETLVDSGRERHSKILDVLKQKGTAQVQDLQKEYFPNLSKRTLRRDFAFLLKRGLVERVGDNNNTMYKLR